MTSGRILVVDDDQDVVEYLCTLLGDHGYEVRSASSSLAAIAILEAFPADLVIIDVLMPGRSGLDLLLKLRQDRRWSDSPVVVLTGSDAVLNDGGKTYLSPYPGIRGADAVLGKPVDPAALLAILEQLTTCPGNATS